jgi:hypothetical protein
VNKKKLLAQLIEFADLSHEITLWVCVNSSCAHCAIGADRCLRQSEAWSRMSMDVRKAKRSETNGGRGAQK